MAPNQDHLANARNYIAIAESSDSRLEAYAKAADEIIAAQREDPTLSFMEIDRRLGKRTTRGGYSGAIVRWRTTSSRDTTPFSSEQRNQDRDESKARKVLRERPEVVAEAIEKDPKLAEAILVRVDDEVIDAAHDRVVARRYEERVREFHGTLTPEEERELQEKGRLPRKRRIWDKPEDEAWRAARGAVYDMTECVRALRAGRHDGDDALVEGWLERLETLIGWAREAMAAGDGDVDWDAAFAELLEAVEEGR